MEHWEQDIDEIPPQDFEDLPPEAFDVGPENANLETVDLPEDTQMSTGGHLEAGDIENAWNEVAGAIGNASLSDARIKHAVKDHLRDLWIIGDKLNSAKEITPHGEWEDRRAASGLQRSSAASYMQLAGTWTLEVVLEKFDSFSQARAALPTKIPERPEVQEEKLSSGDERLLKHEETERENERLKAEIEETKHENRTLALQAEAVKDMDRPQLQDGVAQIANARAETRSLKSELAREQMVTKDLRREISRLRRMVRELGGTP